MTWGGRITSRWRRNPSFAGLSPWGSTRIHRHQLRVGKFRLHIRQDFLMVRNAQTWDRLRWTRGSNLYEFATAVLIDYHAWRGKGVVLKLQKLSFYGSGGWKSDIRCRQGWGLLRPPLLGLEVGFFSPCSLCEAMSQCPLCIRTPVIQDYSVFITPLFD